MENLLKEYSQEKPIVSSSSSLANEPRLQLQPGACVMSSGNGLERKMAMPAAGAAS